MLGTSSHIVNSLKIRERLRPDPFGDTSMKRTRSEVNLLRIRGGQETRGGQEEGKREGRARTRTRIGDKVELHEDEEEKRGR